MAKLRAWSSAPGILGIFFLIAGITGAVFQFIWLYLPYFQLTTGDWQGILFFALSIAAMAFGALILIISLFGIPKVLWIIFAFLVVGCSLVLPIWLAVDTGTFVYVVGDATQFPYLLLVPTNPMLDFVGFWLAAGGSFLAMIFGIFIPKEY
jgi:hypothetical protein